MRNYKPVPTRNLICEECHEQFEAKRSDIRRCKPCAAARRQDWRGAYERNRVRQDACPKCGEPKAKNSKQCKLCWSKGIAGASNPSWKGGVTLHHAGYRQIRTNRPGRSNGYELEHRLVWEAAHGPIPSSTVIHHVNGDPLDNRLENLMAMSNSEHRKFHDAGDQRRDVHLQARDAEIARLKARLRELEAPP